MLVQHSSQKVCAQTASSKIKTYLRLKSSSHLYPEVVQRYTQLRIELNESIYQLHLWTNRRPFENLPWEFRRNIMTSREPGHGDKSLHGLSQMVSVKRGQDTGRSRNRKAENCEAKPVHHIEYLFRHSFIFYIIL